MKENQNNQQHIGKARTAFFFCTLAALISAASCAGIPTTLKKTFVPTSLTIMVTNRTLGAIEPTGCGCRNRGGLARRSSLAQKLRSEAGAVLVLDAGAILPPEDYPYGTRGISTKYLLEALAAMGTDAVNMSLSDSGAAAACLEAEDPPPGFICLSANIHRKNTRDPLFQPWVIKKINSLNIGIFGLSPAGASGKTPAGPLAADIPFEAAATAAESLRDKGCTLIIALSQLSPQNNSVLARRVQGIDFILGSADPAPDKTPRTINDTVLASPGEGGSHAALLHLHITDPAAHFSNRDTLAALRKKIEELKYLEQDPPDTVRMEDVILKRAVVEKQLAARSDKNTFRYSLTALDKTIPGDARIQLLVEQYKTEQTKQAFMRRDKRYIEQVPGITMEYLSPSQRLKAVRIMNSETCREDTSIAAGTGTDPLCRSLGQTVVTGVVNGRGDGQIGYDLLYQKQRYLP